MDTKIPFDRRIGAKLQQVIENSDSDNKRRADFRQWLSVRALDGSADPLAKQVFVRTTIVVDPPKPWTKQGRQRVVNLELKAFLDKSDAMIRRDFRSSYIPTRYEGRKVRALLKKEDVYAVANIPGVRFLGVSDPVYAIGSVPADDETRNEFVGDVPQLPDELARAIGNQKVLMGLIDVDGFDISHPAFIGPDGKTLFACIWDQTAASSKGRPPSPARRRGDLSELSYGHDFDARWIDEALARSGQFAYWRAGFPTTAFGSHGTHVASIAAGNTGICRKAVLAGVVFARDHAGRSNTTREANRSDGERLGDAIAYLRATAVELDLPLVINISLGRNCGAHDGSPAFCREIDAIASEAGCCVVVAAGNAGDSRPEAVIEGRIHANGEVPAGGAFTLRWRVNNSDDTDNEMEIWYSERSQFVVSVIAPNGERFGPIGIDDALRATCGGDGSRVFVYHSAYDAGNGCNYVCLQLSPPADRDGAVVFNGVWQIELAAHDGMPGGQFHAWIERDDGSDGLRKQLQSHFESDDPTQFDNTKVNSLACGQNVIAVASWDTENNRINPMSNQGPTRDGRGKPDVAAPGTRIWGANGFPFQDGDPIDFGDLPLSNRRYRRMTGTSMAAPYVAGIAALMLALNPTLTAAQIRAIMIRTAKGTDQGWQKNSGYGHVDFAACLNEARRIR